MFNSSNEFDVERAIIREEPLVPPLTAVTLIPLAEAKTSYQLPDDAELLLMTINDVPISFNLAHLVYHHVAQGKHEDTDWMATFCMICNGGACFSPVVDGNVLHFTERGIYNAMSLIADVETGSIWNHLTGVCMHGPLKGAQLEQLDILTHSKASDLQIAHEHALFAPSQLSVEAEETAQTWNAWRASEAPEFPQRWLDTISYHDPRLPRTEMGLGVWSGKTARFYPFRTINAHNNTIIDTFAGRKLLVYVDPSTSTPYAIYIDTVSAFWRDEVLQLDNGLRIQNGLMYQQGKPTRIQRPEQLFQRWYSFAILFPTGDIY